MKKGSGKIDYEALKMDFFTSKYKSFSAYYKDKYSKDRLPGNIGKNAKGWAKQKKDFKENALDNAVEDAKKSIVNSIRPQVKELEGKLCNILKLVDLKIKGLYDNAYEIVYDKKGNIVYKEDSKGNFIVDKDGAKIPMLKLTANMSATEINRLYDMVKTELKEPARIHNSRLTDGDGKNLPQITGVEVEIIKTTKKTR